MAGREFKPGHRGPGAAKKRGSGIMSPARLAWLRVIIGQFVLMKYNKEEYEDIERGDSVVLFIPRPGGRGLSYNITALTAEELNKMREFFTLLFDTAAPIVAERDRIADEALAAGDDSHSRVYRQVPQFIVRKRSESSNDQGVHDGLEDSTSGNGRDGDSDGGVRGGGDELVDSESSPSSSEDYDSEIDEPESLRQVGGDEERT